MEIDQKITEFLESLENKLIEKNFTVPEFAKRMGVSKVIVYKWLQKEKIMSLENYYKALEVLGLESKLIKKRKKKVI